MSDEEFVQYLLTDATPFTQEKLVPEARIAVFYVSSVERQPRSLWGAPLMCGGDTMYVAYDLPLPPGASAGPTGRGIGILDMGKITPIVEWPAYSRTWWSLGGCVGRQPVVWSSTSNGRFVSSDRHLISDGTIVHAEDSTGRPESQFGTYPGLPGGATCHIARVGDDYFLEAATSARNLFRLVDGPAVDAALRSFEKRPSVKAYCFRFAQRDFVEIYGSDTNGMIYRIDRGSLTLVGVGGVLGGSSDHMLLEFDNGGRRWFNEERAPA